MEETRGEFPEADVTPKEILGGPKNAYGRIISNVFEHIFLWSLTS